MGVRTCAVRAPMGVKLFWGVVDLKKIIFQVVKVRTVAKPKTKVHPCCSRLKSFLEKLMKKFEMISHRTTCPPFNVYHTSGEKTLRKNYVNKPGELKQ